MRFSRKRRRFFFWPRAISIWVRRKGGKSHWHKIKKKIISSIFLFLPAWHDWEKRFWELGDCYAYARYLFLAPLPTHPSNKPFLGRQKEIFFASKRRAKKKEEEETQKQVLAFFSRAKQYVVDCFRRWKGRDKYHEGFFNSLGLIFHFDKKSRRKKMLQEYSNSEPSNYLRNWISKWEGGNNSLLFISCTFLQSSCASHRPHSHLKFNFKLTNINLLFVKPSHFASKSSGSFGIKNPFLHCLHQTQEEWVPNSVRSTHLEKWGKWRGANNLFP